MSNNGKQATGKTILSIVVTVLILAGFFYKQCNDTSSTSSSIDKELAKAASEINKTAPFMIDENTRFDNMIALPGKILQYSFTAVNMTADEADPEYFENEMKPMIINQMKTNPQMEKFRKAKVTLRFFYKDMNGSFITQLDIAPELYQ